MKQKGRGDTNHRDDVTKLVVKLNRLWGDVIAPKRQSFIKILWPKLLSHTCSRTKSPTTGRS
jgi:hypothetical protein